MPHLNILLLNESVALERDGATLHLAGIDDPHYYQVDNLHKAAAHIPLDAAALLLAHSPEPYRLAAHAGFDLMLSGHTHGGQICLPGGMALMTNADCPPLLQRRLVVTTPCKATPRSVPAPRWSGCVSNCPPEMTLHRLRTLPASPTLPPEKKAF